MYAFKGFIFHASVISINPFCLKVHHQQRWNLYISHSWWPVSWSPLSKVSGVATTGVVETTTVDTDWEVDITGADWSVADSADGIPDLDDSVAADFWVLDVEVSVEEDIINFYVKNSQTSVMIIQQHPFWTFW